MGTPKRRSTRFTLDLERDLHRALKRYAVENDMHASDILRDLLTEFLAAKRAGDAAVEAAVYRRGYQDGTAAERQRIVQAVQTPMPNRPGLPTSPPSRNLPTQANIQQD
jgi:hypothetical protein